MDGFEFLKTHQNEFDVIITDAPDPIGPGAALFQLEFYGLVHAALKSGGIMCSQGALFRFLVSSVDRVSC